MERVSKLTTVCTPHPSSGLFQLKSAHRLHCDSREPCVFASYASGSFQRVKYASNAHAEIMWIIGRSFWSSVFGFGGAASEGALPAPGNGNAGGARAPPPCNAAISAAMGSSAGGGAEDPATEEATAVVDDAVDEARGRCCSGTGPTPGKRPEAAALSIAFMNCCCCSSDQTEGSGAEPARPAAWSGDVCVGGAPLTLREPGVDAGGVGMSEVSPTKLVKPVRVGIDADT